MKMVLIIILRKHKRKDKPGKGSPTGIETKDNGDGERKKTIFPMRCCETKN